MSATGAAPRRPRRSWAWWSAVVAAMSGGLALAPFTADAVVRPMSVAACTAALLASLLLRVEVGLPRALTVLRIARDGVVGALALVAFAGWAGLMGPSALLVPLALTLMAPQVLARLLLRWSPRAGAVDADASPDSAPTARPEARAGQSVSSAELRTMATREIVALWQHSALGLERCRTAQSRARIALVRQQLLDELDRRDHAALQSWLATMPSPSSDPTQFFSPEDPPSSLAS